MTKLNVAVIGAGNMGKHHARIYAELPNVTLAAICDSEAGRGEFLAQRYGCLFYPDYKSMFAERQIDAVSVAVPTFLHRAVACDALDRGAHVLLEKPIATSLDEAARIIQTAQERNRVLMVGHVERFNPAVRRLAQLVHTKRLGDIISLNIRRVGGLPPQTKNANVVMDLAIHDIDIANFLMQESPLEVRGFKSKNIIDDQEDSAVIILKYAKSSAIIEVNWVTPVKIRTLDITGTGAFARLDYVNQKITLYESNYERNDPQYKDFNEFISKFHAPDISQIGVPKVEPLKCELEEFITAIEEKREPMVTAQDAYRALEIALRV